MRQADPFIVEKLNEDRIEMVASAFASAFINDPLAKYMIPDVDQRAQSLPAHFAAVIRMGHLFGDVYSTRHPHVGAAVWFGPDAWELNSEQLEQSGAFELPGLLPDGAFERFQGVLEYCEKIHKRDVPAPHWYLALIGVSPDAQGQGIGGALLQPILHRADNQGFPCYLETAEQTNLAFYEKHGFDILVDEVEPGSGLRYWTMLRQPE